MTIEEKTENSFEKNLTKSIRRETAPAESSGGGSRFTYTVAPGDEGMTVKLILKKRMGFSGRLLTKMKQQGTVTRNGVEVRLFADVIEGDVIDAVLPEERCHFIPQDIPIEIVYEDEDMIVINKEPWVVVHPTKGHPTGTIANGLMKLMEERDSFFKIRFVNRLDRDTSGLLIVAKNSHCQDVLTKEMKSDLVDKRYIAVVHGIIEEDTGTIDLPIGRKNPDDIERSVMPDGYPSVTHYKVLERLYAGAQHPDPAPAHPAPSCRLYDMSTQAGATDAPARDTGSLGIQAGATDAPAREPDAGASAAAHHTLGTEHTSAAKEAGALHPDPAPAYTLLELRLETGRTHQIRVHMSHIGHPLVGDPLYGRTEPELLPRQALHAARLSFDLPVSSERITVEAPLPADIEALLAKLRSGADV